MEFVKYHGLGNDFIIVEDFASQLVVRGPELAKQLCHRHFGIGADGLVLLTCPENQYTMRIFNPDGSEAEMCGNAIRCLAKHLLDRKLCQGTALVIGTLEGAKEVQVVGEHVTVNMGQPIWNPADIPMQVPGTTSLGVRVEACGQQLDVSGVSMGNPHGVIHVDALTAIPFEKWGKALETHPIWPNKANVEFVQVQHPNRLAVLVWERGVGPTLACGTGACAAAVVSCRLGLCQAKTEVLLPGGGLLIEWQDDDSVLMTGPAAYVYAGTVDTVAPA